MQALPQSWGIRKGGGALNSTQAKLHTLVSSMNKMLSNTTDPAQQLVLVCCSAYYNRHATGSVMPEVSAWKHIVLPTVPYLVPNKLPHGALLHMLPENTKNMKGGHSSATLTCDVSCLSTWLQLAVAHNAAAGASIAN